MKLIYILILSFLFIDIALNCSPKKCPPGEMMLCTKRENNLKTKILKVICPFRDCKCKKLKIDFIIKGKDKINNITSNK